MPCEGKTFTTANSGSSYGNRAQTARDRGGQNTRPVNPQHKGGVRLALNTAYSDNTGGVYARSELSLSENPRAGEYGDFICGGVMLPDFAALCQRAKLKPLTLTALSDCRAEITLAAYAGDPRTLINRLYAAGIVDERQTVGAVTWERDGSGVDTAWIRMRG